MLKPKTFWALVVALSLTPLAIGVNAEPPTWAKQKKTEMMKEAKPGTGPGLEGGKSHAKPKGKAYGVHGTQPSKAKGEEAGEALMKKKKKRKARDMDDTQPSTEKMGEDAGKTMMENEKKDMMPEIDDKQPSAEKMKEEAAESMKKKGKSKAKGKGKEKKMK